MQLRYYIHYIIVFHSVVLVNECEFCDDETVYRFIFDVDSPLPLHKALNLSDDESHYTKGIEDYMKRISIDADSSRKYLQMFWKGGLVGSFSILLFCFVKTLVHKASLLTYARLYGVSERVQGSPMQCRVLLLYIIGFVCLKYRVSGVLIAL